MGRRLWMVQKTLLSAPLSSQLDVRFWHLADIDADPEHVRSWG